MPVEGSPEQARPVGRWPERKLIMYEKARFSYSTDINPRLYEVASRLEVPYLRLVFEAFQEASPINLTADISAYLDRLDGQGQPNSSEGV